MNRGSKRTVNNGVTGEAYIYFRLTSMGIPCTILSDDSRQYDLLADIDGKIVRIQVKSSIAKKPNLPVKKTVNGKFEAYSKSDFDILAVVSLVSERAVFIYNDGKLPKFIKFKHELLTKDEEIRTFNKALAKHLGLKPKRSRSSQPSHRQS